MLTTLKFCLFLTNLFALFQASCPKIITKGTFFIRDTESYQTKSRVMPSAPRHKPVIQSSAVYHICSLREDCLAVNRTRKANSKHCPNVNVRWKKMLKETSLKRMLFLSISKPKGTFEVLEKWRNTAI